MPKDSRKKTIAKLYIIHEREAYSDLLTTDQALLIDRLAVEDNRFREAVDHLMVHWRGAAYLATLHSTWADVSLDAQRHRMVNSPEQILSFSELFVNILSIKVPEIIVDPTVRSKILKLAVEATSSYAETLENMTYDDVIEEVWKKMLDIPAFQMYIWYSQRTSFMFIFSAYESFLIAVCRVAGFSGRLRTGRDFMKKIASVLGQQAADTCWESSEVRNARFVRNTLAHNGFLENCDEGIRNGVKVLDGQYQITIDDNKKLIRVLEIKVEAAILAAKAALHLSC